MKKIVSILIALGAIFTFSCSRQVVVPDEELAMIFRDAFLANAYVLSESIEPDSLQIYAPIFEKYGYTVEDMQYTIGNFSKRKSARLSTVVEEAIKLLEGESKIYEKESAILDTIDAMARRRLARSIYSKDKIEFFKTSDSLKVKLELDSLVAGSYTLSFKYLVDTLDDNHSSYRVVSWFERDEKKPTRLNSSTGYLKKESINKYERKFEMDSTTYKFKALLCETYANVKRPHITIKDVNIEYMPPLDGAVDSMFNSLLDIKLFSNDFFKTNETDSLKLSAN